MKLTNTTFIAALAMSGLLACGQAFAQDSTPNPPQAPFTNSPPRLSPNGGFDRIAQMLNLTDDQKTQVQPIIDGQRQKLRAVFQNSSLSSDGKRTQIKAIHDATNAQMKTILTPEQYQKWTAMQSRVRRMPPGGPGGPGGPRPNSQATNAPAAPTPPAP